MYKRYAEGVLSIEGLYKVFYTDDIYNDYNLKKTNRRPLEGLQSIETLKKFSICEIPVAGILSMGDL